VLLPPQESIIVSNQLPNRRGPAIQRDYVPSPDLFGLATLPVEIIISVRIYLLP
jgi:hypothetical protein